MSKILTDYRGFPVRLTEERLIHILDHPEMALLEDRIEETLQHPEQVRKSNTDNQVILNYRYYLNTLMGDKWLCVVTKYLDHDAFLLTAYLTNRIKQGELLCWTVRSSRKINEFTRVSAPNALLPSSRLTIAETLSMQGF